MAFKVGDNIFWRVGTTAGEGIFVGELNRAKDVLVIGIGASLVEIDAADCSPTGGGSDSASIFMAPSKSVVSGAWVAPRGKRFGGTRAGATAIAPRPVR